MFVSIHWSFRVVSRPERLRIISSFGPFLKEFFSQEVSTTLQSLDHPEMGEKVLVTVSGLKYGPYPSDAIENLNASLQKQMPGKDLTVRLVQ